MDWKPRTLLDGLGFPEGPVALPDGSIAFVEIRAQRVSRYADGARTTIAEPGGGPNGASLGADGALYVANNGGLSVGPEGYWHAPEPIDGRIQRVALDGAVSDVASEWDGEPPRRPNDLCFGPDGLLYFTDPHNWEDIANLKPGRLCRTDVATAKTEVLAEVPWFPNGIAFGPDGRLYVAQSIMMTVLAFPWSPAGVGDPVEHCKLPAGFPDGFCFTADGDLIVCGSMGHVIQVFDAAGTLRQTIETGDGTEPTNSCIADGVLYVTMSGTGELVGVDVNAEPLPLHPR